MYINQRGVIHLYISLLILVIVVGVVLAIYFGVFKKSSLNPFAKKEVRVELKTEYKNPFAKETQYVNPFEPYKNPFVVNR